MMGQRDGERSDEAFIISVFWLSIEQLIGRNIRILFIAFMKNVLIHGDREVEDGSELLCCSWWWSVSWTSCRCGLCYVLQTEAPAQFQRFPELI